MAGDIIGWEIALVGVFIGILGAWLTIYYGKRCEALLNEIRDRLG